MRKAVLIINLGTPDNPQPQAVGRYLRQFLMDKWVIDVPAIFRWIMVHLLIVPRRKFSSSEAYEKIWTQKGSPLLFYSQEFCKKLQAKLGDKARVKLAMRYGNPSIQSALFELQNDEVSEISIMPMYPQYAESSTRSSLEEVSRAMRELRYEAQVSVVPPFYAAPGFVESFAELIKKELTPNSHLLMTFHGLPERHVEKTDTTGQHCLKSQNCCDQITEANLFCYRAHAFASARAIAAQLKLTRDQYTVSFQSRLGRSPWIKPYTDFIYLDLIKQGKKDLVVVSPSFVTDCLETLEELGMRLQEDFLEGGGERFTLVPCLNDCDRWVDSVAALVDPVAKT